MKCGRELHIPSFGFGKAICPDCYHGESQFLFYDTSYWLNRLVAGLFNRRKAVYKGARQPVPRLETESQEVTAVVER